MSNPTKEEIELYEKCVYANIDDILFGIWLGENGWCFYDGADGLINLKGGRVVASIKELYADFKSTLP